MAIILIIKALLTKIYNDIQSWSYTNSVIVNAGGFTIGYSTYYYVTGLLTLLTPLYIILTKKLESMGKYIGINKTGLIYIIIKFITNIILLTCTWLITLLITFFLLEYVLNIQLLGLKSNIKENEKKDFIISKTEAQLSESIIENSKKLEKKNEKEFLIGSKILKNEEESFNEINEIDIKENNIELFENEKMKEYDSLVRKIF
jgi:hypothetical protein